MDDRIAGSHYGMKYVPLLASKQNLREKNSSFGATSNKGG